MRQLPAGLQAHLDSGATTLCRCWRLARADGAVFGFTDHDRDLAFDGTQFEAASGLAAGEMASGLGLAVDHAEVAGALSSAHLDEAALAAGLFDNAAVEVFVVNWADPAQRVRVRSGHLGEVTRAGGAFRAEIRGLAHALNQPAGRLFRHGCDADLGDARCGVDLAAAAHAGAGTVSAAADRARFEATGLAGFAAGWFARGTVVWTSGVNAGRAMEVRAHRLADGVAAFELWQPMAGPIAPGDAFEARAGCDKLFATCREKFANGLNFRGFPHMPGNDFVISWPLPGEGHDGSPLGAR